MSSSQSFTNIAIADVAKAGDPSLATISHLYRKFRRRAMREPGANAQGDWTLEQDDQRSDESYLQEVTDTRYLMYVCVRDNRSGGHRNGELSIAEKTHALLNEEWVSFCWLYGPLTLQEWTMPTTRPSGALRDSEFLFAGGGVYSIPSVRKVRDSQGETLAAGLLKGMYKHVESQLRRSATSFPVHFRTHGNLTPQAFADGRMLRYYRQHLGYVVVGTVPGIVNLAVNNRVLPPGLRSVYEDKEFYTACTYAAVERHAELREDGSRLLLGIEDSKGKEKARL